MCVCVSVHCVWLFVSLSHPCDELAACPECTVPLTQCQLGLEFFFFFSSKKRQNSGNKHIFQCCVWMYTQPSKTYFCLMAAQWVWAEKPWIHNWCCLWLGMGAMGVIDFMGVNLENHSPSVLSSISASCTGEAGTGETCRKLSKYKRQSVMQLKFCHHSL